ncbi:MAG: hypothetical protein LBC50_00845 [Candidatus Ancillula sp.]|nr:hypothetical protein [Candidatus Ancillula sp.]
MVNFSIAFIVLTLAAFILFPSGYITQSPGPTYNVLGKSENGREMIRVKNIQYDETNQDGEIMLLTVAVMGGPGYYLNVASIAPMLLDSNTTILPREAVFKAGVSSDDAYQEVVTQMNESQHTSVNAALKYLKQETDININPNDIKIAIDDVGGPSAGLAFALGIIDKAGGVGLARGRKIATTGACDDEGNVLPIGGAQQKMEAALGHGASILLVPEDNYASLHDIPAGLTVIPVSTVTEAVEQLLK